MQSDYIKYTRHRLKYFEEKQNIYGQQKFMMVEKTAHKIVKGIVQDRKALIFVGATKFSGSSPVKGYVRSLHKALLQAMRVHDDVVETNEFRTTNVM